MRLSVSKILIESSNNTLLQLFRYTIVGGIAFLCDIGLLFVLTEYFHIHYIISASISFIIGLLVNYFLSKIWVFTNSNYNNKTIEFTLFAFIGLIGLILNNLFLWFFTDYFHIWYILSKVITTIITYLWNFFARKYLLFNNRN